MLRDIKQFYVSLTNWIVSFIPAETLDDVLILRLDQLGDFVLWLDSAKEYRKLYYGKRLTLLVNANWYDLAKSLPYWDVVVPLDTMRFRLNPIYRIKFLIWVRKQGFEVVICPRHSVKFTLEPPIVAISGARQKIVCEGSFPIEKKNYFTRSIPMYPERHELSRNAQFLRGLGRPNFKSTVPYLNMQAKTETPYIIIFPTSFRKRKEWPLKRFISIMHSLFYSHQIIVCGDRKLTGLPVHVHNLTGKTNILQLLELISASRLVIANDSAPIHLAAALDRPSICIGAEHLGRFLPYEVEKSRDGMVFPRLVYSNNLKDITTEEVLKVVKEMLNGH